MKILVVDDSVTNRLILVKFLTIRGYELVQAEDGVEAIKAFKKHKPDLILMDVNMPNMDGYEATREIRQIQGAAWVPIIIASALATNKEQIKGLEAGADDYVTKPIDLKVLAAKIEAKLRIADLQEELNYFYNEKQHEIELAGQLMTRMYTAYSEDHKMMNYKIDSCTEFSGDFVVAKNIDEDVSYVMLGDVTGHGLAAAITSIPALEEFYRLAEDAKDLSDLVVHLNDKMHTLLPTQFYIAAILIRLDKKKRQFEIWNGGMCEALLLNKEGTVSERFPSTDLPLGIIKGDVFLGDVTSHTWSSGKQLFCCSDGLIEAVAMDGEDFGEARYEQSLKSVAPHKRINKIRHDLKIFMDGFNPHDDVSLLEINLD